MEAKARVPILTRVLCGLSIRDRSASVDEVGDAMLFVSGFCGNSFSLFGFDSNELFAEVLFVSKPADDLERFRILSRSFKSRLSFNIDFLRFFTRVEVDLAIVGFLVGNSNGSHCA